MSSRGTDPAQEQQIAAYLTEHTDFFVRHPQALTALHLPHTTGAATSLFDRQMRQLREQNQHYCAQLETLLQVARENEAIAQRLHQLTLSLMRIRDTDGLIQTLPDQVLAVFQADAVAIKLFAAVPLQTQSGEIVTQFRTFLHQAQPACGPVSAAQSDYLFQNRTIRSVVVLPLQSTDQIGMLAVGSRDEVRFHAQQGMDFLQRFNDIVNAVLRNTDGSDASVQRHIT